MKNGLKKFAAFILATCLLMTSTVTLAESQEIEAMGEVIEETAVSQDSVQKESIAEEPVGESIEKEFAMDLMDEAPVEEKLDEKEYTESHLMEKSSEVEFAEEPVNEFTTEEHETEEIEGKTEEEKVAEENLLQETVDGILAVEESEDVIVFEETDDINKLGSVSENILFEKGFVEILRETVVYADSNREKKIAVLEGGIVEATDRIKNGEDGDQVIIQFEIESKTFIGYVNSEDVCLCTEEQTKEWFQGNKVVKGKLICEENVSGDDVAQEDLIQEEGIPTEAIITEGDALIEAEVDEIVEASAIENEEEKELEVEVVLEEEIEIAEVIEEENTFVLEEDSGIEEAEITLDVADVVVGDVVLEVGNTSNIPIPKGINAKAYAAFDMVTAGLLTLTFKSVSVAHGNVMVSIKDSKDVVLWTTMWASSVGTVNYSAFVEADSYVIIIEKTDSADDAAYVLSAEPIVSKTGEAGIRNNTQNNATTITVDGTEYTGIVTQQDVQIGRDDYYKFTLSSPGYVMLQYSNLSMSNLRFILYGNDTSTDNEIAFLSQNVMATSDRNEMQTISVNRNGWLDAGVYFIMVSDATIDGRYRIRVTTTPITITEKERNNTFQQAYDSGNMLPLNDTVVTSLLGESDTVDCYDFYLEATTLVSFSLRIQFRDVTAAIYSRDGKFVVGSNFGATYTTGSDGNPYELELRKFRLDSGYYYVRISKSGSSTGKYSISAKTTVTASTLTVDTKTIEDTAVIKASATGGNAKISYLHIYEIIGSNTTLIDTFEYRDTNNITLNYFPKATGDYLVQYVVNDGGLNGDEKWEKFSSSVRDFNITVINTSIDGQGKVHCKANYTGKSALRDSYCSWYLNGVKIDGYHLNGSTEWEFVVPVSGLYSIQFSGTLTGGIWKEGWTTIEVEAPSPILPLTVDSLNVSSTNTGIITSSAETKNGIQPQYLMFALYKNNVEISRTELSSKKNASFTVNANGIYTVQCVAYDGITWADKWASITVNMSSSATLTVKSLSVKADDEGNGIISMVGTSQGGGPLVNSHFNIYYNGQQIDTVLANNGTATKTVFQDGVYAVQYVISDGQKWVDKWATVSVTLKASKQPVVITSASASADSAGAITIQSEYTSNRKLQKLNYHVYDSSEKLVNAKYTTDSKEVKLYVTKSGTYLIQVVAFDGEVWADYWLTVPVSLSGASIATLSVTALTLSEVSNGKIYMNATTNDNRQLESSVFHVYEGTTRIRTISAPNKEGTCSGLPVGNYIVQYVAFDGTTWVDKWGTIAVGSSTLSIDSMTVVKIGNTYKCTATVTNNKDIQSAWYRLYDASDAEVAVWYWDGTGSYLEHTFLLDSAVTVTKAQYVLFDGIKWIDAWDIP